MQNSIFYNIYYTEITQRQTTSDDGIGAGAIAGIVTTLLIVIAAITIVVVIVVLFTFRLDFIL